MKIILDNVFYRNVDVIVVVLTSVFLSLGHAKIAIFKFDCMHGSI